MAESKTTSKSNNFRFEETAKLISQAANKTVQEYKLDEIPDEVNFTSALVTRFRDAINSRVSNGIFWQAKILKSHTEEGVYGADLLGLLSLDLNGRHIKKGFLVQAKRLEEGKRLPTSEWGRLKDQCEKMLKHSKSSYVFLYASTGVYVISAAEVVKSDESLRMHNVKGFDIAEFYKRHFSCSIGDPNIYQVDLSSLKFDEAKFGFVITGTSISSSNIS